MIKYIAFLRGINVGGNNIIKMEDLRIAFEKTGFQSVRTYIQSGNVLFQSGIKDEQKIEITIEKELAKKFNYEAKVIVRSEKEMENIISHFPEIFENPNWKHNIMFLSKNIDSKNILKQFEIKNEIEEISYYKGVIYWSAKIKKISRSTMIKLSSRKEYKEMTVRNVNTAKKVFALMKL
jgi:uncharacterized protein (DUF1697 family)